MIGAADVRDRAREWSLREHVVEKDYVLGWFLWAIGTEPGLSASWVFKGGTCLKKCYFETYRFSEDLDFTVREEESLDADALRGIFSAIGERIYEASGIEVPRELIRFEAYTTRRGRRALEGRVSYRGPLQPRGDLPRVKLDLTADEVLVQDPVARQVTHPFTDGLPADATVRCYSIAEVFAEKIRALSDRCLPRDLYDVVSIHRHPDLALEASSVYGILERKCAYKGIGVPTLTAINELVAGGGLVHEWENMLRHQLPELPPLGTFLAELPSLFDWLTPRVAPPPAPPAKRPAVPPQVPPARPRAPMTAPSEPVDPGWSAPATIGAWGASSPVERIRFAAANRVCVDLGYDGSVRRIEPYGLKRTMAGDLLLSAVRRESGALRYYRVDRIEGAKITNEVFQPRFAIELWGPGGSGASQIPTPAASGRTPRPSRSAGSRASARTSGSRYVVECCYCGKQFRRRDTHLMAHKMKGDPDSKCLGRHGQLMRRLP